MKKGILILILFYTVNSVAAQQKKDSLKFACLVSAGWLKGEIEKPFSYQFIGGIRRKNWFGGIGAAYDPYGYKSLPVFVDARRYFGKQRSWQPLVYADAGLNFAFHNSQLPKKMRDVDYTEFTPAFYGELGAGIDKRISKRIKLNLSAGFSYKQFNFIRYAYIQAGPIMTLDYSREYNFYYRRVSIRLGVQF